MVWFYKRDHVSLSIETRYDNETSDYVAVAFAPMAANRPSAFARERHFGSGSWQWSNSSSTNNGCRTARCISCLTAGRTNRR